MADKFNVNDLTPAAPGGRVNVLWQSDVSGNVSAHVAPAGAQTPWTQHIDAAGFELRNAGKVGIGTAPVYPLDVSISGSAAVARFKGGNAVSNNTQIWLSGVKDGDLWTIGTDIVTGTGSKDLYFYSQTGAATVLTLGAGGSVGIGTASPTMALHVAGQGFYSSSMQNYDPGDGSGAGTRIGYNQTGDWGYVNASNTGVAGKGLRLQPAGGWVSVGSLGTPLTDSLTLAPILYATSQDNGIRLQTPGGEVQARLALKMDGAGQPSFAIDGPSAVGAYAEAFAIVWMTGGIKMPRLPSSNPGAGTKQLYYDPADGNRVKFAA